MLRPSPPANATAFHNGIFGPNGIFVAINRSTDGSKIAGSNNLGIFPPIRGTDPVPSAAHAAYSAPMVAIQSRPSARPHGFEQEPGAALGFVDPHLDEAGAGNVDLLVAERM